MDVADAAVETVNGESFSRITASGIPGGAFILTDEHMDFFTSRPKSGTDWEAGSVHVGDKIEFGQDVGYVVTSPGCATSGFWPPGPACPADQAKTLLLPREPSPATTACYTGMGALGIAADGVSLYGWSDGQSYNGAGVWNNVAQIQEIYDLDLGLAHAANGDLRKPCHIHTSCVQVLTSSRCAQTIISACRCCNSGLATTAQLARRYLASWPTAIL